MKPLIKPLHALQKAYKQTGTSSLTNCESLPEFHELLSNLTKINLEDVGLNLSQVPNYFKNNTLTYMNILQASGISIDLFCLPKGGSFKLHDHTNMLVITKILSGSAHCKAFDLVDRSFQERVQDPVVQDESDFADVRLEAVLHEDRVLESGEVTFLTPEKGNIHSIVALENVILVDFLLPGYSQGNLSTYYEEVAMSEIKTFGEETKGFSTNCVKSITSYNSNENNCGSDVETNQSSDEDETRRVNRRRVLKPISDPDEMRVRILRNPDIEIKDFDKLD